MKRVVLIFVLFVLASVVGAERWADKAPGSKGQFSTMDPNSLEQGYARRLLNLRRDALYGALVQRRGLYWRSDQDNFAGKLLGVYGYYNARRGFKSLIGVESQVVSTDTVCGRFIASDTFQSEMFDPEDTLSWIDNFDFAKYPAFTDYYDFEKVNDLVIICDGSSPPWVFSQYRAAVDTTTDTVTDIFFGGKPDEFSPNIRTLCPEAPGQLRVSVWNASGNLNGAYQYKIAYTEDTDADAAYGDAEDSCGRSGVASRTVYPSGQQVYLSLFEGSPSVYGEDSTTRALIIRRKENGPWYVIDTLSFDEKDTAKYLDNIADASATIPFVDDTMGVLLYANPNKITPHIPQPGAFVLGEYVGSDRGIISGGTILDTTKDVWIAYSYYDPVTGAESRLGPIMKMDPDSGWTDSSVACARTYHKCFSKQYERPDWIRTYRSVGDDSTTVFAMYQLRANLMLRDSVEVYRAWMPIWGTDDEWLSAAVTPAITNYNYGTFAQYIDYYQPGGGYWVQITRTIAAPYSINTVLDNYGNAVVRAPYLYGSEIVLKDIEYANGRAWGFGDPEFPQRLYYSAYDTITDWNPSNYLSLDEDDADEIVAVEKAEGTYGDVLYVFKRNKIFLVTGYDPEYDLTFYPISTTVGAATKRGIQADNQSVYFLSSDFRVCKLVNGDPLEDMSMQVVDSLRSMYDYVLPNAGFYELARPNSFRVIDNLIWNDLDEDNAVVYHLPTQTWGTYEFGRADSGTGLDFCPAFDVAFDTVDNDKGFRSDLRYYFNEAGVTYITGGNHYDYMSSHASSYVVTPKLVYESPCLGDGVGLWRITEVTLSVRFDTPGDAADSVVVGIYGREFYGSTSHDAIVSVGRNISGSESTTNYRFEIPEHAANCVSFRVTILPEYRVITSVNVTPTIYEVSCEYERVKANAASY